MENSRRSKKRSKFFWPEIGLLLLGLLGFKPDLLFDVIGIGSQANYGTARPVNQLQPTNPQPLTSNPLLAWGIQAIQSAASHSMGGLPVAAPSFGQPAPTQQPYYPNYAVAQNPQYQQPLHYGDYGNQHYQMAPNAAGYSYPNANLAGTSTGNYYNPNSVGNYYGQGSSSRVPSVDYQTTPASYPSQLRTNAPFPSTTATPQPNISDYGNTYGANVRKEGAAYDDPRMYQAQQYQSQLNPSPYPTYPYQTAQALNSYTPYTQTGYGIPNSNPTHYVPTASAQSRAYPNGSNQISHPSQSQYYWGAVDPRSNNIQRQGTQGSWVPNVPASNLGAGRSARY